LPVFHGRHLTAQHGKKGVCVGYYVETGVANDHNENLFDGGIIGLIENNIW